MAYVIGQKYLFGSGDDQGTATYVGEYNGQPVWSDDWGRLRVGDPQGGTEVIRTATGFAPMPAGSSYGDQGIIDYWAANPAPPGSSSIPGTPGYTTSPSTLYPPSTPTTDPTRTIGVVGDRQEITPPDETASSSPAPTPAPTTNPPSEGPHLGNTFPGAYETNPNLDAQYAQWRDERRANGEDPYDMNAFRQHLIAIGAPDPGAPQAGAAPSPAPSPTPSPTPPPTTPPPPGATLPPPTKITPPTVTDPPAGAAPGREFAPTVRSGRANELLAGFGMPDMPELDIERLFNWLQDPKTAAANTLAQAGFDVGAANPFVSFLQGELPRMANISRLEDILGGGTGRSADIARQAPRFMGGGITANTGTGMIPQLASLARQFQSNAPNLTETQRAFSQEYLTNPNDVLSFLGGLQNLAPDLRQAQQQVNTDRLRRYQNVAGADPNKSIWDFLGF